MKNVLIHSVGDFKLILFRFACHFSRAHCASERICTHGVCIRNESWDCPLVLRLTVRLTKHTHTHSERHHLFYSVEMFFFALCSCLHFMFSFWHSKTALRCSNALFSVMDSSWFVDCFNSHRQKLNHFPHIFLPFSLHTRPAFCPGLCAQFRFLYLSPHCAQCNLSIKCHQELFTEIWIWHWHTHTHHLNAFQIRRFFCSSFHRFL